MKKAFGYCRSSTAEQEDSIQVQAECTKAGWQARFKAEGYLWGGVFKDKGVSGKHPFSSRPAAVRMLAQMEPGDMVIITKLDRGFRNLPDLITTVCNWELRGFRLVLLDFGCDTGTPVGKMLLRILATIAEFERDRISERMRETQALRTREGRPLCQQAPYGTKLAGPRGNRRIVPDPYTRAVGAKILGWADGGWSLDEIYFHLLREKVKTRLGKEWSRGAIQRAYSGEVALQKKERKATS